MTWMNRITGMTRMTGMTWMTTIAGMTVMTEMTWADKNDQDLWDYKHDWNN